MTPWRYRSNQYVARSSQFSYTPELCTNSERRFDITAVATVSAGRFRTPAIAAMAVFTSAGSLVFCLANIDEYLLAM